MNNLQKIKYIFLLVLTTGSGLQVQSQEIENSLFWEVSGKGLESPSYLFGTYHVLNHSYLHEVPSVKATFEKMNGVVVETVIDSAKLQQIVMKLIRSSKKLPDLVNEDDYKLIAAEVEKTLGADMTMMGQFKPVFITYMLTMVYNQQENNEFLAKYSGTPIDIYFASAAKKNGKPVSSFETMEEQFDILFKHDSEEKQAEQLVEFVKTNDEMRSSMKELTTLYVNQDLKGMHEMYKKYAKQFGSAAYLLDDRNIKWIKALPAILQQGNQFIAVGALHFTGEKGLIKLLREAGYTVKPVSVK